MKRIFATVLLSLLLCCTAFAQKAEIFQKDGLAIRGYDAVAFHSEGKAVKGLASFETTWKEAKWRFVTQDNLDQFKSDPERYAPQYGGYCAYGTADGHKAPTETETWTIDHGKLYFNYNKKVQTSWNKSRAAFIKRADKNWPEVKDTE